MEAVLRQRFAMPNGYPTLVASLFQKMFTDRSQRQVRGRIVMENAGRLVNRRRRNTCSRPPVRG